MYFYVTGGQGKILCCSEGFAPVEGKKESVVLYAKKNVRVGLSASISGTALQLPGSRSPDSYVAQSRAWRGIVALLGQRTTAPALYVFLSCNRRRGKP